MGLLDKCAGIYSEHVVLPVCPSVTLHDIRICAKLLLKATINLLHH